MTDPLVYIKAKRVSLHDLDGEDIDLLVREVERLRDERDIAMRLAEEEAAEARRLHGLLARLEWAGPNSRTPPSNCPVCLGWPANGHYPGCEWVAVMQRREEST